MIRSRLLGNFLLVVGLACLLVAAVAYVTDLVAPNRALPRPVALDDAPVVPVEVVSAPATPAPLQTASRVPIREATGTATIAATATRAATATPSATPSPTATPRAPGAPVRVAVPSIGIDSKVQEAGAYWENGQLVWETVPFVVAHYIATARAGELGNAVFSGHVTSRSAGNVFKDLYLVHLGDEVHIYTVDFEFVYVVTDVKLVLPTETSVMNPMPDATATLITCAGEWDPVKRVYSHRLIVTAKLKR